MDEGKFAADFISQNLDKIWDIAKKVYGTLDEVMQVKLKTAYKEYLLNSRTKYSKSKSFFIRNQAVDLYSYYVATSIRCGSKIISEPSFDNCTKISKRIVVSGTGGTGKTVLMKHLFLDCIKDKRFAPIFLELRDLNILDQSLDSFIENTLDTYGFKIKGTYILRAKKEGHFCFFLDGFDEVNYSIRKKLIQQIKQLSNKYSKCPIIISTRPDDTFKGIDEFSICNMLPLNLNSATNLIEKLPFDEEIKNKFIKNLKHGLFKQHKSFLSNPLLLSIMLLTYRENAEIPSKLSVFYNQAYEALFQRHDAQKGGYSRTRLTNLDIQDFSRIFSLFCLQTYEKRIFKMSRIDCLSYIEKSRIRLQMIFSPENYLTDLLSAACLLLEDGLEIAFSHRSFQEYFVALHISSANPEIQEKLIERYWVNINSDAMINILYEINPDLIERLLFIPILKKTFNKIKVKRKVGISHTAKLLKNLYESINIRPDMILATFIDKPNSVALHRVLKMFNLNYSSYSFPEDKYFKKQAIDMSKKYAEGNREKRYKLSELTYKSPVLADILTAKGSFSIEYLQSVYDAYKKLKMKHENSLQNIDDLLGI